MGFHPNVFWLILSKPSRNFQYCNVVRYAMNKSNSFSYIFACHSSDEECRMSLNFVPKLFDNAFRFIPVHTCTCMYRVSMYLVSTY